MSERNTHEATRCKLRSQPYLEGARRFARTVLDKGRGPFGKVPSPLFAEGLHVETFEPATWIWKDDRRWVFSNFWNQQALMRMLDGLTALTGDASYRHAAEAAAAYMLEHAQSSVSGLLFAGGHTAWDLLTDGPAGTFDGKQEAQRPAREQKWQHEMKGNQPYWELMWRVNPTATRKAMRAVWFGHMVDWRTLDFNRHCPTDRILPDEWQAEWDQAFDADIAVPYGTEEDHLSFAGVVPPFLRSGVMMATLAGDGKAFEWSQRLITLWHRNRHPATGLGGGQISWRRHHDRAVVALAHVYPEINEANIVANYHLTGRYFNLPLAQMASGAVLAAAGGDLAECGRTIIRWAAEDLKTLVRTCWDSQACRFTAKMTDGTPICVEDLKPGYYTAGNFLPVAPSPEFFWGCAMAYRLTGDAALWQHLGELGRHFDLGEFGAADGKGRCLNWATRARDPHLLHGLLELARATRNRDFVRLASRLGDHLVALQHPSGLFPRPAWNLPSEGCVDHVFGDKPAEEVNMPARVYARTSDEVPLALLHLAAEIDGRSADVPQAVTDSQYFHCPYKGPLENYQTKWDDLRTYDWLVFYGPGDLTPTCSAEG